MVLFSRMKMSLEASWENLVAMIFPNRFEFVLIVIIAAFFIISN